MALHNEFGSWGEDMAARHLVFKGYALVARNWRFHHLEIDIIAEWYGELVFVEVKSRKNEDLVYAKDAVDLEKKKNLIHAAKAYMNSNSLDQPFRFDIITLVGDKENYTIEQIENAFTVTGVADEVNRKGRYLF